MKKTVLLSLALALTASVWAQAPRLQLGKATGLKLSTEKVAAAPVQSLAKVRKANGVVSTKFMGTYEGDRLAAEGGGLNTNTPTYYTLMTEIPSTDLQRFDGGNIVSVKFGLATADSIKQVSVYGTATQDNQIYSLCDTTFAQAQYFQAGWHEVRFNNSFPFSTSRFSSIFLVFTYYNPVNPTAVSFVDEGEKAYPVYVLYNNQIYSLSGVPGNLSIKAGVEKDWPAVDLGLVGASLPSLSKTSDPLSYNVTVANHGTDAISSFTLKTTIDGQDWHTLTYNNTLQPDSVVTLDNTGNTTLPQGVSDGAHTVKVVLTNVNGQAPAGYTGDDTTEGSVVTYSQTVARQKSLIEQLTSWTCTWCPNGSRFLDALKAQRNDIAWVAIHGDQSSTDKDIFDVVGHDSIEYVSQFEGWPSASFNRMYTGSGFSYGIGYSAAQKTAAVTQWNNILNQQNAAHPSFVTLNISPSFDAATRQLTVTVTGTGVTAASAILKGSALTVYLTEDSLIAKQLDAGTWKQNYVHNNVLRKVLTNSILGDDITWNGDNFTRTFTYTVPAIWRTEKMHIIAFVAPKLSLTTSDYTNLYVDQCEMVPLTTTTGIYGVKTTTGPATVKGVYSVSGARLDAPQKGVNIIVYSDGKTEKVVK